MQKNDSNQQPEQYIFEQKITRQRDDNLHKIILSCPSCNKPFEHIVGLQKAKNSKSGDIIQLKAYCPNCGQSFSGSIQKQP